MAWGLFIVLFSTLYRHIGGEIGRFGNKDLRLPIQEILILFIDIPFLPFRNIFIFSPEIDNFDGVRQMFVCGSSFIRMCQMKQMGPISSASISNFKIEFHLCVYSYQLWPIHHDVISSGPALAMAALLIWLLECSQKTRGIPHEDVVIFNAGHWS